MLKSEMGAFNPRLLAISTMKQATEELERVSADKYGVIEMASKTLTRCIKVAGLECRQANILKQEMLSVGGDAAVARGTVACSVKSTDCILIGTEKQLSKLCKKLLLQPFSLSSLAVELTDLISSIAKPPLLWRTSRRAISLERPLIMGIINLTPDSFSDGGLCVRPDIAVERALQMEDEGADIIDIGGESTRPGATAVSAELELSRVIPVIEKLAGRVSCAISIDTWKSSVAVRSVDAGAEIVNDISGFNFDAGMPSVVSESSAAVVLMHTRGTPDKMQQDTGYSDLMAEISAGLRTSLSLASAAGIPADAIAIDPGIGFGKSVAGNMELIRRLSELSGYALPILTGPSRKSFIGSVLGREQTDDRLFGTAAAVALSIKNGASIVRVHDVKAMRDVADMAYAIMHS
ncbi:MAG: dihydropteroate synthase [Desulfuromonadaceae bacterium]|nr:dihydropteroate synthase [Desulfuromonadaceae bacterium]MDD2854729.1 dihydropteroate synthase [Desulfuromonadaceae bacterium]